MTKTEKFIEAYKTLEREIANAEIPEMSVYDLEQTEKDSQVMNRLKLSRLVRNYLQHNDNADGFIVPTDTMISFLKSQTEIIKKMTKTAKDISKRVTPVDSGTFVVDAAEKLKRAEVVLVVDKGQIIGLLTRENAYKLMVIGAKNKDKLKKHLKLLDAPQFIEPATPANEAGSRTVVTSNGKKDGKYIGLIP